MGGGGVDLPTAKQRAARPIKELLVNGKPCEDRVAWSRELKQHCDKSSDDERNTLVTQRGGVCATGNVECNRKEKGGGERGKQLLTSCYEPRQRDKADGPGDCVVSVNVLLSFPWIRCTRSRIVSQRGTEVQAEPRNPGEFCD